jgi:Holliday junction resolvase RusA-like endonuclease
VKRTSVTIGAPISVNKMYTPSKKFGFVKSKFYRRWIEKNLPIVEENLDKVENFPIEIEIKVIEGYGFTDKSDIQNYNKAVVDLLVRAKIIPDDCVKYVTRCEEKFMPFWNSKKSEAITHITYIETDQS